MSNPILDEYEKDPVKLEVMNLHFQAYFDTDEKRSALKQTLATVIQHTGDADALAAKVTALDGGWDSIKRLALSAIGLI